MLAEFSIVPVGKGESLSKYVAEMVGIIEASGISFETHPMGTILEGDWDEVMAVIKDCHESMSKDGIRATSRINIDLRPGKANDRMTGKIESLEKHLGHKLK